MQRGARWEYQVMTYVSGSFGIWDPDPRLAEIGDIHDREGGATIRRLSEWGEMGWELAAAVPVGSHEDQRTWRAPAGGFDDQFSCLFYMKRALGPRDVD